MKRIALQILFLACFLCPAMLKAQESGQVCNYFLSQIKLLQEKQQVQVLNKAIANVFDYDVKYYRMKWYINPAIDSIKGSVLIYYKVTAQFLPTIAFDMDTALHVDSIKHQGVNDYNYSFPNFGPININLTKVLKKGDMDSIEIFYHGQPNPNHRGFVQETHAGAPIVWTLSEPFYASDWWPCKQDLVDKADSIDVYITIPQSCKAACNGVLEYVQPFDTFLTYYWKHRYPITPYLVGISVTNYKEFAEWMPINAHDSMPILNYVWPEDEAQWHKDAVGIVPALLNYGKLFGTYPFAKEKYGNAEFPFGGGQEHQTMSFVRNLGFTLFVHEMAHQWFGDKITCNSWQDIWLNEGFATYCELISAQKLQGEDSYLAAKRNKINGALKSLDGSVAVDDTTSVNRIFAYSTTYCKGGMVLSMLRYMLGDSVFFQSVREYINDTNLIYSFAQTEDLRKHFEKVSGQDLTKFFDDWIYKKGYPVYTLKWRQSSDENLILDLLQSPTDASVDYFNVPVPIRIWSHGKDSLIRLNVTSAEQEYSFQWDGLVDSIHADPNQELLAKYKVINLDSVHIGKVYMAPNPVKDFITLEIKDLKLRNEGKYSISDAIGRVLLEDTYQNTSARQISLLNFPNGVYVFNFHSGSTRFSKKFIKLK